ncbi:Maltose O-acetyltransferase [Vibrio rotiferianus]|uniref:acyltransferase n=1 Tax=Vibrio rotiferianus TaxID=190895 RepID=UPI002893EB27|nr:Maltose O-acetyltransferase [Vibrio rotiferianus]
MARSKPLLTKLRNRARDIVVAVRLSFLTRIYGMKIGEGTIISMKASVDKTNPKGVHIGRYSYVAYGAIVLTHDFINKKHVDTFIGDNVFIGAYAVIIPGVSIANNVVIAAGSIVTKSIDESNCIVAGNPAKVIKRDVAIGKYGKKSD